jgi:hypothetical protein
MSGPRQIQPLVFLQETSTQSTHPANSHPSAPSFSEYMKARQPQEKPEFTEEQLAFRRLRSGEVAEEPAAESEELTAESVVNDYPEDDVPSL